VSGDAGEAGACVPCPDGVFHCVQVRDSAPGAVQGARLDLTGTRQPDGTCRIGGVMLTCGGTGSFADTTPLTWTYANGTVTFEDPDRVFTCTPG
jgi:hypothetical protein